MGPHDSKSQILGIYRHETSLVIPCRTSSPDTVVTLTGVRPHKDSDSLKRLSLVLRKHQLNTDECIPLIT